MTRTFVFAPAGGDGAGAPEAHPPDDPGSPMPTRARLDTFLASCDLGLTRSQIKRMITEGDVAVAGVPVTRPGHRLHPGDAITVTVRPPAPLEARAQDIPLVILHEDAHLLVVDKPAGLVVHPAPGHPDSTLVNAVLAHCHDLAGIGGTLRPGIVHRLDKDTSGVLVVAKDEPTHHALIELFQRHALERAYLALCAGPIAEQGTFSTLHGRHPRDRKKFTSRVTRGKPAVTHYRVLERLDRGASLVRCELETGRTHQIRVHLAEHGAPVLGDPLYGRRPRDPVLAELARTLGRQALHAAVLGFVHPITGEPLRFATDPPADLQAILARLRGRAP